jgi:hypothetical protein
VAARSKAWTVFARSNAGIWVRIPIEAWMSVCVYSLFVLFCMYLADLWRADPPSKESYSVCIGLRNWKSGQCTKSCRAIESSSSSKGKDSMLNYLSTKPWRRLGEWRYNSIILDLMIKWKWVGSFTSLPLYPLGNRFLYRWIRGWVSPRAGLRFMKEIKILPLPDVESQPSSPQPVAILRSTAYSISKSGRSEERHFPVTSPWRQGSMDHSSHDNWKGNQKCSQKTPSQCHFTHHKSHMY